MTKLLIFAVALAALIPWAFADVGPGPTDIPSITLHATIDGQPVPDGTDARLHCFFANGTEFMGPTGTWSCESGTCTGGMYKLALCASHANATFEFTHPSFARNYTTVPMVEINRGNNYYFNVSISTVKGVGTIEGNSTPQPPNPCGSIFIILALSAVPLLLSVKR
jgi:hypothetical protein